MDPAIQQSLQEIASLLLIVHDDYLKGVSGSDVLLALVELIDDVGLAGQVSLLDAERLRRMVMQEHESDMGYELFYDWLRSVGQLVSVDRDAGGKKALHYLLTQYIIPFASTLGTRSSGSDSVVHSLPYYDRSALRTMSDHDTFILLWFHDLVHQICSKGPPLVDFLALIGNFTKYSVVPDIVTDDQAESFLLLASHGSSGHSNDMLPFAGFLHYLELLAHAVPRHKLPLHMRGGGAAAVPKLQVLLVYLADCMLQRRSFEYAFASTDGGADRDAVDVFDEDRLQEGGIADDAILHWLRAADAIHVPHVQIPIVAQCLGALAATEPALVLSHASEGSRRLWRASETSTVLYTVVKHLTTFSTPAPVSRVHEVLFLMRQVPGVFYCSPTRRGNPDEPTAAVRALYSVWTAPLLQDAIEDINASLNKVWLSLRDAEGGSNSEGASSSENFTSTFGNARAKILRALRLLTTAGLVPSILSAEQFVALCGAVQGDRLSGVSDEAGISQGRLFDALYVIAHEHWHQLENWRRKRALDAPPAKLSTRQPQREQQVFQVFLYLIELHFPTTAPGVPVTLAEVTTAGPLAGDSAGQSADGLPADPAYDSTLRSPPPRTALQIISDMINHEPSSQPLSQRSHPSQQLMVSFNSNLHVDGSPIRNGSTSPLPRSFFADHPLRDIAVLLTHYPVPGFAHAPWTMLKLLRSNSESFPTVGYGDPAANTDALLTSLLSGFCLQFHVSSNELSQFFANYYLTAETNSAEMAARAKEQALRSPVMDFLMSDEAIAVLSEQADLFKWEYARCYSVCRATGDPLLDSVAVPLLTNVDFERLLTVGRLSVGHLRAWAAQRTALRPEEVEDHIGQVACLSGSADQSVTFSTFVLFAIRCFTHGLWIAGATAVLPLAFRDALGQMLDFFRVQVQQVEDTLKVEVMQPLFSDLEDLAALSNEVHGRVATAALEQFAAAVTAPAPAVAATTTGTTAAAFPGDGRIPPRPPKILWDAPRFAQFCRDLGVLAGWDVSATSAWSAFGLLLRQEDAPGLASWTDGVVPPIPLRAGSDLVRKLFGAMAADTMSTVRILHKTVVPVLCAAAMNSGKATQDGLRCEDLLRYGGSAAARSVESSQSQLQRIYAYLCEESAPLIRSPGAERSSKQQPEVALSVLCRYLALSGLLRAPAVAMQVKRSLHIRQRPGYRAVTAVSNRVPPEVVTISYAEFEEVVLRVAFLLWEVSAAHAHREHIANEAALLAQAHLQQPGGPSLDAKAAASAYVAACSAVAKNTPAPSDKRVAWGVDFLGPYLTVLEGSVWEKKPANPGIAQTDLEALRRNKGSVRFGRDVILNEDDSIAAVAENKQVMRPPIARKSNSFSGLSSEVISSPTIDLTARSPSPTGGLRSASNQRNTPSPLSDAAWRDSRDRPGSGPGGTSPKMQPSQRIIQSSTERFLQRQESSEQFVVAVDSLVNGTKEALWPVYATYCSCGDSLDPGKLSGPNLFTLLSKLGVLTDRTSLSDVGTLLHQTAAHTLTGPSANAVAMLYESGEYFEAPSLTFEEFLVFLCAFSQLRYKGEMLTPETFHVASGGGPHGSGPDRWFKRWQDFMYKSNSFRHLLGECILPVLQKQMLLAFPEDARLRDRFCCVFSVEVLIAIEGVEGPLSRFFETERARELSQSQEATGSDVEISAIITALKRINLIPSVMGEPHVLQLIQDVLPEQPSKRRTAATSSSGQDRVGGGGTQRKPALLFPQWEWVLSVVAFQAVVAATEQSAVPTEAEKIPGMVADVISSIASAITQQL